MGKSRKAAKQTSAAEPAATTSDSARPDSNATPEIAAQEPVATAQPATQASTQDTGNVAQPADVGDAKALTAARACVRDRLRQHPEWKRIIETVREMRVDPKLANMTAEARERFIWAELDRLYPPLAQDECKKVQFAPNFQGENQQKHCDSEMLSSKAADGRVQGLGDLPPGWPELPANASLAADIGWVQANRLYVVEELAAGGTRVRLDRAHEPAPSRAAIGWLETSIRSYAKFIEVAAKATSAGLDEQDQARTERMQLDEIRSLLAEMV